MHHLIDVIYGEKVLDGWKGELNIGGHSNIRYADTTLTVYSEQEMNHVLCKANTFKTHIYN